MESVADFQSPLTLDQVAPGGRAVVRCIGSNDRLLRQRLLAMGIVAGTVVEVICTAPFGDPIQIRALDYRLSLRRGEAAQIVVER